MVHQHQGRAFASRPTPESGPRAAARPQHSATIAVPVIDSRTLLEGGRELGISQAGEIYRLRVTRTNKLILTK